MSRFESDFLGQLEIPDDCYYGVQTLRGKENFHITEMSNNMEPFFLIAYAYVKKAAALTNKELGTIPADVADALVWACDELIAGKYQDQFVTDWLQGGAGTSTNMYRLFDKEERRQIVELLTAAYRRTDKKAFHGYCLKPGWNNKYLGMLSFTNWTVFRIALLLQNRIHAFRN